MSQLGKQIRAFTLIGVVTSIVGYLFLMYEGYDLNRKVNSLDNLLDIKKSEMSKLEIEVDKLEQIKSEKLIEIKKLENGIVEITSNSTDPITVSQGKEFAAEVGIPTSRHFKETGKEERNLENAKKFEGLGFTFLLERNVNAAIDAFVESENSYNGYHQVYEIARFLTRTKKNLLDKDSEFWSETYETVLKQYNWKIPEKFINRFNEELEADKPKEIVEDTNLTGKRTDSLLTNSKSSENLYGNSITKWCKKGYYVEFNELLRISVKSIGGNSVALNLSDISELPSNPKLIKSNLMLNEEEGFALEMGEYIHQIKLEKLGKAGKNPLTKAAFLTVTTEKNDANK